MSRIQLIEMGTEEEVSPLYIHLQPEEQRLRDIVSKGCPGARNAQNPK